MCTDAGEAQDLGRQEKWWRESGEGGVVVETFDVRPVEPIMRPPRLAPQDPLHSALASGPIVASLGARWQELGLASEPNTGDNGVHASASPFEVGHP